MWLTVEPDNRGNFSLFLRNVMEEEELQVREDFGEFGLHSVHRPAESRNLFLRFTTKEFAEKALNSLHEKYNLAPAYSAKQLQARGSEKPRDPSQERKEGFQNRTSPRSEDFGNSKIEEHFGVTQKDNGFADNELLDDRKRNAQRKENGGPPPLVRAAHSQHGEGSVPTSDFEKDGPPPLVPAKSLQSGSGRPQLVPARHSINGAGILPLPTPPARYSLNGAQGILPLTTSPRYSQNGEMNGPNPLVSAIDSRIGDGDCPPSLIREIERLNGMNPDRSSLSHAQMLSPRELPAFNAVGSDDMPKHANEMFVANVSEHTTSEDLLSLFTVLEPEWVSPLKYTDVKAHIPYRIIKFPTCRAVTYALKNYQNFLFHGKHLYLCRFSTLIEMVE